MTASHGSYAVTRRWRRWALGMVDCVGARWWHPQPQPPAAVRRLLLIRLERWGDVVTLLPAIARARELFPGAHITWMAQPPYCDFIAAAGVVDEVWRVRSRRSALAAALAAWVWDGLRRRERRFDLALDFHADLRYLLLGRIHARRLAGHGIRGGGFLLDVGPTYPWTLDAATRHVRLVEAAASGTSPRSAPTLRAQPRLTLAREWSDAAMARLGDWAPGFLILHPGCGQPSKRWPVECWRELLARCRDQDHRVALTGGEEDRALCRWLAASIGDGGSEVRNLAGQTGWGGLAGLVARAGAVVAPDTGIIHLAQALGTPTVALFGPSDPTVWGYATARHRSLARRMPCSYCNRARCPRPEVAPSTPSPCLEAIAVEEVWRALGEVMARSSAAHESRAALLPHGPRA